MAHTHGYCRHCQRFVVAERPSRLGSGAGVAAVALGMGLSVLGASLIGPFIMFAIPFMALFGFALGPLAAMLSAPATCPGCAREVRYRHPSEIPQAATKAPPRAERRAA